MGVSAATRALLRCMAAAMSGLALAASLIAQDPPPRDPRSQRPDDPYGRPRFGCSLANDTNSTPGMTSQVIKPAAGTVVLETNEILPLIVLAEDSDSLIQICSCRKVEGPVCSSATMIPIADIVSYKWSLTGRGRLRLDDGHANLYEPPELRVGERMESIIALVITDARGDDNPIRIRFRIRIERAALCEYRRTILIEIEDQQKPDVALTPSSCACEPVAPTWKPDPTPIAPWMSGPPVVCAGEKYLLIADGSDSDFLLLQCAGECGSAISENSARDSLRFFWSAMRGGFPDHSGIPATTNGSPTSVIYKAPDTAGPEQIEVIVRDSGLQAVDVEEKRKLDMFVLVVDLDVDSDDTRAMKDDETQDDPERTKAEDDIEDRACDPGKTVRVNNGDEDNDCVRDYADGFNVDGNEGADASPPFTPLILEIPDPIPLDQVKIRFRYSASDPAGTANGVPAAGALRIWSKDGRESRRKEPLTQNGEFVAAGIDYRPLVDFPAPIASRTWRFFVEGIDVSSDPGDLRIVVEIEYLGEICEDAVRLTGIRVQNVAADAIAPVAPAPAPVPTPGPAPVTPVAIAIATPPIPDELPLMFTSSRPQIELDPISPQSIAFVNPSRIRFRVSGSVRDRIADISANRAADIASVTIAGAPLAVTRDASEVPTRSRPYAFRGRFSGDVEKNIGTGLTTLNLDTSPNAIGLIGRIPIVIEAARTTPTSNQMRIVSVVIGDTAPEGCFRSYVGRVHDARGAKGDLELDGDAFALEPDGVDVFVTKPYIVVASPPRVDDLSIIDLTAGDRLKWKYTTVRGTWPVTEADLDVDADRDEDIDDDDETIEALPRGTGLSRNGDDDDNDGAPDNADDRINGAEDRKDMLSIVVRRPPILADDSTTTARLVVRSGTGRVRVFRDDGGDGEVVLDPQSAGGVDLWPQLKSGDLTLLVEGFLRGDLVLELELSPCEAKCGDPIALAVLGFELAVQLSEPLDEQEPILGELRYTVPADWTAVDRQGLRTLGVNLTASFHREDELESDELAPDRKIRWEVTPSPSNECKQPKLRDLVDPGRPIAARLDDVTVHDLLSYAQLDFSFKGPDRDIGHAADLFRVRVEAEAPDGERLRDDIEILLVPGSLHFHVTNPPVQQPPFDPNTMWSVSDQEFEQKYGNSRFDTPLGSAQTDFVEVFLFDQFRNPLSDGTLISWKLEGSGFLGDTDPGKPFDPNASPKLSQEIESYVLGAGLARIRFTQTRYPHCPWQPTQDIRGSLIYLQAGDRTVEVNTSSVKRSGPSPPAAGAVNFRRELRTVTAADLELDIFPRDTREFFVTLERQVGNETIKLRNVPVAFKSLNGRLSPDDGMTETDLNGRAKITLTSANARIGEATVVASVGNMGVIASEPGTHWVSSAPVTLQLDHDVLSGDQTSDGVVMVETATDDIAVPYFARSNVTLRGRANHTYRVAITQETAWRLGARYPFDIITGTTTPDVESGRDATTNGAVLDAMVKREGLASLRFSGADDVFVPYAPAIEATGGLVIRLHVRPQAIAASTLLERIGQYKLEILSDGRVRFTLSGTDGMGQPKNGAVESAKTLPLNEWSLIEVSIEPGLLRLAIGPDEGLLDGTFIPSPPIMASAAGIGATVGADFVGHLDDLRFIKQIPAQPVAKLGGAAALGSITTDANGLATFFVESTGNWDRDRYVPIKMILRVTGSEEGESVFWVVARDIWKNLVSMGKAFLTGSEGLGSDPAWFQKAAAWVSESIPFVSDLRTLAFELYKAASGCDEVSMLNVSFAMIGLLADIATAGTAGLAVKQMARAGLYGTAKVLLKQTARNFKFRLLAEAAIAGFVELATKEIVRNDCPKTDPPPKNCVDRVPADWVVNTKEYMSSLASWASASFKEAVAAALRSVDDVFIWNRLYGQLDAASVQKMFEQIETAGRDFGEPIDDR